MSNQHSVTELANQFSGEVLGNDSVIVTGVETLEKASVGDLSFLVDSTHAGH